MKIYVNNYFWRFGTSKKSKSQCLFFLSKIYKISSPSKAAPPGRRLAPLFVLPRLVGRECSFHQHVNRLTQGYWFVLSCFYGILGRSGALRWNLLFGRFSKSANLLLFCHLSFVPLSRLFLSLKVKQSMNYKRKSIPEYVISKSIHTIIITTDDWYCCQSWAKFFVKSFLFY